MDAKPEQPKNPPVMDVVAPPPVTEEKSNPAPVEAAARSEADDPAPEPTLAEAPATENNNAAPAEPAPAVPEHHEAPAPQLPPRPHNPALPAIIIAVVLMIVLSAIAVYAYLKSVR